LQIVGGDGFHGILTMLKVSLCARAKEIRVAAAGIGESAPAVPEIQPSVLLGAVYFGGGTEGAENKTDSV